MILDTVVDTFRAGTYRNPEKWMLEWWGGASADSGVAVGPTSAMKYGPWFQGINIISSDIGKIPLPVFKRTPAGREKERTHPAYRLTMHEFNDAMTADVGKQVLQAHALGWGNGRAAILRDNAMRPLSLVPLLPDRTKTEVIKGEVWHITKIGDGTEERYYRDENVLHIKGLGFDGVTGYSVAQMARNSLGLGLAAEKYGSNLFRNGAVPGVILEADGKVSPADAKQLIQDWDRWHAGVENVGRTGLTTQGIKAKTLAMNAKDAEWLEMRKFQRVDVASFLNLPPHKLGDDGRQSYNSLEQENLSYREGCLLFWFVRWQNECRRKLLTERQKSEDTHYFEFHVDLLASVDFPAKVAALNTLVAATIFNPDEAREKLNMNHRPGGDKYENPNTNSREEPAEPKAPPEPPRKPPSKAKLLAAMAADARFRGPQGEPGPIGAAGEVGPAGPQGLAGIQGERGEVGPQGASGIQGDRGEVGPAGPQGERGEVGPAGPKGDAGQDGAQGPQGDRGEIGPQGPKGDAGEQGIQGVPGEPGPRGDMGPQGIAGDRGPQGEAGPVGPMGERGKDGLPGEVGAMGPAGLAGERGTAGPRGEAGPQGKPGEPSVYGRCLDTLSESIAQEAAIVQHHSGASKNFVGWIETWYPKRMAAFAATVRRLGADESLAIEHCNESRAQLMALTERTTLERLTDDVRALTAAWHERAVVLARRIAGGPLPNLPIDPDTMVSTPAGLGTVAAVQSDWKYQVEVGETVTELSEKDIEVIG